MTPQDVLAELTALQAGDVPTHGGATMAYVYDSGRARPRRARGRGPGGVPVDQRAGPDRLPQRRRASRTTWSAPRRAARRRCADRRHADLGRHGELPARRARRPGELALAAAAPDAAAAPPGHRARRLPQGRPPFGLEVADVPVDPVTCRADPAAVAASCSTTGPRWSWSARRPTRTACSTRSVRSPRWRPPPGSPATSTRASAAGSCRSSTTSRSRSTSRCPA